MRVEVPAPVARVRRLEDDVFLPKHEIFHFLKFSQIFGRIGQLFGVGMVIPQVVHRRDGGFAVRQLAELRQLSVRGQQLVRDPDAPQLIDYSRIPSPRRHLRDTLRILQWGKILLELLPERTVGIQYNRLILC